MNRKHIAFIIYSLESGGAERVVTTLANKLVVDYKVTIITLVKCQSMYPINDSINLLYCLDSLPKRSHIFSSLKNNLSLYFKLKSVIKEKEINLTLGFMTTSNVLASLASKACNIPSIISERSNPYIYTHNKFWYQLVKWSFPKADYLVVQSQLVKNYYAQLMDSNKVVILPNPLSSELAASRDISIEKENIILNVGRLDANKSQDLLIRAFSNMENNDWKLVFVGEGPLAAYYKELAEQSGKQEYITFVGKTKDIASFYNKSKIFAFTSKSEGFPNALIEAMYFGLACISTNCPSGPSELIEQGKNGVLIAINDQKALEIELKKLMTDNSLRETLGNEAHKTASTYKTEYVVADWKQLIESVL